MIVNLNCQLDDTYHLEDAPLGKMGGITLTGLTKVGATEDGNIPRLDPELLKQEQGS